MYAPNIYIYIYIYYLQFFLIKKIKKYLIYIYMYLTRKKIISYVYMYLYIFNHTYYFQFKIMSNWDLRYIGKKFFMLPVLYVSFYFNLFIYKGVQTGISGGAVRVAFQEMRTEPPPRF